MKIAIFTLVLVLGVLEAYGSPYRIQYNIPGGYVSMQHGVSRSSHGSHEYRLLGGESYTPAIPKRRKSKPQYHHHADSAGNSHVIYSQLPELPSKEVTMKTEKQPAVETDSSERLMQMKSRAEVRYHEKSGAEKYQLPQMIVTTVVNKVQESRRPSYAVKHQQKLESQKKPNTHLEDRSGEKLMQNVERSEVLEVKNEQTEVVPENDQQMDVLAEKDQQMEVVAETDQQMEVMAEKDQQMEVVAEKDQQREVVAEKDQQMGVVAEKDQQLEISIRTVLDKDGKIQDGFQVQMMVDGESKTDPNMAVSELMAILQKAVDEETLQAGLKVSGSTDLPAESEATSEPTATIETAVTQEIGGSALEKTESALISLALEQGDLTTADLAMLEAFVAESTGKSEPAAEEKAAEKNAEPATQEPAAEGEIALAIDENATELSDIVDILRAKDIQMDLATLTELALKELGAATKTELEVTDGDGRIVSVTENAEATL